MWRTDSPRFPLGLTRGPFFGEHCTQRLCSRWRHGDGSLIGIKCAVLPTPLRARLAKSFKVMPRKVPTSVIWICPVCMVWCFHEYVCCGDWLRCRRKHDRPIKLEMVVEACFCAAGQSECVACWAGASNGRTVPKQLLCCWLLTSADDVPMIWKGLSVAHCVPYFQRERERNQFHS